MSDVRNPFAIRDGVIILINDLSEKERGLNCECKCPACDGEFIARMGDVRQHHFAHSKEPCDEMVAYTTGLYKLIQQVLSEGKSFYVPSLEIICPFSTSCPLNKNNIESNVKIVKNYQGENELFTVSKGKNVAFDRIELSYDKRNNIQALVVSLIDKQNEAREMAIKVMPPDTVCKQATVTPYNDMATLVLDFTNEINTIQTVDSNSFREFFFSSQLNKYWRHNPLVKKAYPTILMKYEKWHSIYLKQQEELLEQRRLQQERQMQVNKELEVIKKIEQEELVQRKKEQEATDIREQQLRDEEIIESIKSRFTQQTEQIRDRNGERWVECEFCGKIDRSSEFSSYGGINRVNLGKCRVCRDAI